MNGFAKAAIGGAALAATAFLLIRADGLGEADRVPVQGARSTLQVLEQPIPVASFRLQDQLGRPFTPARLYKHWTVAVRLPDHCGAPCRATLTLLSGVHDQLIERNRFTNLQVAVLEAVPNGTGPMDRRVIRLRGTPGDRAALALAEPLSLNILDPLGRRRATIAVPYTHDDLMTGLVGLRDRYGAECCFTDDERGLETVIIRGTSPQFESVK